MDHDQSVETETAAAQDVMRQARFSVRDTALFILTILAIFYTLYFAAAIILPFVFAIVLSLLLSPAARFLTGRLRLPRMLAAFLLIVALFTGIGSVGYAISMPAAGWIAKAPQSLPTLQKKLSFLRKPIAMFRHGMDQMQHLMETSGSAGGQGLPGVGLAQGEEQEEQSAPASQPAQGALPARSAPAPRPAPSSAPSQGLSMPGSAFGLTVLAGTRSVLGQALTLIIMLFFLLADGDALLRRFVEILPSFSEKKRAVQIATEVERNISGYLATITAMNALVGIANGLSVWAFGLPDPLLFGTVAFLLNYIPLLGPLTGVVIFFFVGLFTFSNVLLALAPAGVYLLVHVLEGETITPMLLARRFTLNPLLVIASLMFWDWLWGVAGALLAVPMLAVFKILCDNIPALTPVGHVLGAEANHRRKA